MEWYLRVLGNYFQFSGRARRKEYWMFILFNMIFAIVAIILDNILGLTFNELQLPYGFIYLVYLLAVMIPGIAVTVRRLHDVGKSGWIYFVALIPLVGAIWLLILLCKEGDSGSNQYGHAPK